MKIIIAQLAEKKEALYEEKISTKGLFAENDGVKGLFVKLKALYISKMLIVNGNITGKVESKCNRCLEFFAAEYEAPFEQSYEITNQDDEILLDEDIRQAFLLGLPIKFLCNEQCKGLCDACGINLNTGKCECQKKEKITPFSQLKNLINKKKN
ncbi:DUF177 domain-containing protein [bacterium]